MTTHIVPAPDTRPVFTYKVPSSLAAHGVSSIGLVELNTEEEMMAQKRAPNDMARMTYELAKAAVAEVDGHRVSLGDGSTDRAWAKFHPKVRTLVVTAYNQLHNPSAEESSSFFASRQTSLG